ncbi:MAG: threonine/serine dehydratase, partial [Candidatus Hodarchaeota archaeon]
MITLQIIKKARETIRKWIKRTPLIYSQFLSDFCGSDTQIYLKLENLQLTNSFKIRGAFNRMAQLNPAERKKGVITASSGNHGQAVALAAEQLQIAAKIIVPTNVSKAKLDKIKKYDVELIQYGDYNEVEPKAIELATKEGLTYISPYNDELIIAGQGTLGLEILEDLDDVN